MLNWMPVARWFYGLMAAVIGGGSSAVVTALGAAVIDPKDFNAGDNKLWMLIAFTFCFNAGLSAFLYLSKAPLPDWDGLEERRADAKTTITATTEIKTEQIQDSTKEPPKTPTEPGATP